MFNFHDWVPVENDDAISTKIHNGYVNTYPDRMEIVEGGKVVDKEIFAYDKETYALSVKHTKNCMSYAINNPREKGIYVPCAFPWFRFRAGIAFIYVSKYIVYIEKQEGSYSAQLFEITENELKLSVIEHAKGDLQSFMIYLQRMAFEIFSNSVDYAPRLFQLYKKNVDNYAIGFEVSDRDIYLTREKNRYSLFSEDFADEELLAIDEYHTYEVAKKCMWKEICKACDKEKSLIRFYPDIGNTSMSFEDQSGKIKVCKIDDICLQQYAVMEISRKYVAIQGKSQIPPNDNTLYNGIVVYNKMSHPNLRAIQKRSSQEVIKEIGWL